jgi:integrase
MPSLKKEDVTAALRKSDGNMKFTKYSAGESLFLMVRNGRGYWRVQYRDGQSFKAKVLGTAADLSPTEAGHERDAFMVARRNARKGLVTTSRMSAATAGAASAGVPPAEPLSALLARFMIEHAPQWKSAKVLLEGKSPAQVAELVAADKAGKAAKDYRRMFAQLPADILAADAQTIQPLAFRTACKAIWPDNADSVARMMKRLATLQVYQATGVVKGSKKGKAKNRHASMPYPDVPAYVRELMTRNHVAARALRWTILSAVRANETREATWSEIVEVDDQPCWFLSAERMKAENSHTVPLTEAMLDIIGKRPTGKGAGNVALFPGSRGARFINNGLMLEELRKTVKANVADVHGFRTSFRSWAADCTDIPREVAEKALAHVVPGVEGDYQRGLLLAKRRKLMDQWAKFCGTLAGVPVSVRATA